MGNFYRHLAIFSGHTVPRPSQDVFLLPLVPWIEQGGSILLAKFLYYLYYGITSLVIRSELLLMDLTNQVRISRPRYFAKCLQSKAAFLFDWHHTDALVTTSLFLRESLNNSKLLLLYLESKEGTEIYWAKYGRGHKVSNNRLFD